MAEMKLNRKEYEKIRKMDHGQMQTYFMSVYLKGFEEGKRQSVKESDSIDMNDLIDRVQSVKGIGGVKARMVASIVTDFLSEKENCT